MTSVDLLAPPNADVVSRAIEAYAAVLRRHYGDRLKGLYLFGSRARGDFDPFSDVDLAVILDHASRRSSETKLLSEIAYDIFLESGAEIQPWIFEDAEWQAPGHTPSAALLRVARREALPVQRS